MQAKVYPGVHPQGTLGVHPPGYRGVLARPDLTVGLKAFYHQHSLGLVFPEGPEWLLLVHVEEEKPGRPPRRTLYPFVNTHSAGGTPRKGYTARVHRKGGF